jgi:biotin carboxyl carrier protein
MELVVKHKEREAEVHLERLDQGYRIRVDGEEYEVDLQAVSGDVLSLIIAGRQYVVSVARQGGGRYRVSGGAEVDEIELMDPLAFLAAKSHGGGSASPEVKAYMPGRVVTILVKEGEEVTSGQGLVILEAMKMENEILAERDGTVQKILVEAGQAVDGGDVLFELG